MSAALDLYARLTETSDEKERARLIAEAFDALEARFPRINDLATQGHVRESELRLQKEIKEVEGRLQKEIKEVEVNLHKAIAAQTRWMIGGLAILGVILKLADVLIGP